MRQLSALSRGRCVLEPSYDSWSSETALLTIDSRGTLEILGRKGLMVSRLRVVPVVFVFLAVNFADYVSDAANDSIAELGSRR